MSVTTADYFKRLSGGSAAEKKGGRTVLLSWALIFFVIALVAAIFGFTGIAVAAARIEYNRRVQELKIV